MGAEFPIWGCDEIARSRFDAVKKMPGAWARLYSIEILRRDDL